MTYISKPITSGVLSSLVFIVLGGVAGAQTDTPVQSFTALQPLVMADQQIMVWTEDGRKTTGKLVAVGGGKLEIRRPPRFFGAERRDVFSESSVRRIEHRDSTTVNGGLIGFAVGLAVSVALYKTDVVYKISRCEDLCDGVIIVLAPVFGPIIGAAIDGAINRPLFVSPTSMKVVTAGPEFGRARVVFSVSVPF